MKKIVTAAMAAALSMAMTVSAFAASPDVYAAASTHNYGKTATGSTRSAEGGSWSTYNGSYIYKFPSGVWANSCWLEIDDEWYHFNGVPVMETGWIQDGGNWYYLRQNEGGPLGSMVTGWNYIDGSWYYFAEDDTFLGMLYENTTTPDGYTVGLDGAWIE